jgi:hypothetical protein
MSEWNDIPEAELKPSVSLFTVRRAESPNTEFILRIPCCDHTRGPFQPSSLFAQFPICLQPRLRQLSYLWGLGSAFHKCVVYTYIGMRAGIGLRLIAPEMFE